MTFARGRLAFSGFATVGFFAAVVFATVFLTAIFFTAFAAVLLTVFLIVLRAAFFTTFFTARFFTGADEGVFGMVAGFRADMTTPRGRRGALFRFTAMLFYNAVIAGLDPAIHLLE
ncbi:hypothetical protein [Bradyrhizobium sp. G127]|uniref:hypothetical protein n=1 Tax=Bradyrhizobium sp. G127 TaxID=2904800 RepID=UPI001F2E77DC|nr:hypothetical protein [Bradyrhizobium sp. G127]MCF2523010.1 hypothetical protein [Bradyrhizobium sp. G127]